MKNIYLAILTIIFPVVARAENIDGLLSKTASWIESLAKIVFGLVIVAFFWGLALFLFSEEQRNKGKSILIWGIIVLFVMTSIWGIVQFLNDSTGINKDAAPTITLPTIQ